MGGEVAFAVRDRGTVSVRVLTTGSIQPLVHSRAFLEEGVDGEEHDWGTGTPLPVAAPVPHGYGLVVVDRDTRWVASAQRYTSVGAMTLALLIEDFQDTCGNGGNPEFEAAWREGLLSGVEWADPATRKRTWQPWASVLKEQGWSPTDPVAAMKDLELCAHG